MQFSWLTDILLPIATSLLTGLITWVITVMTSNARQRLLMRTMLNAVYDRFRLDIVRGFLEAEGVHLAWKERKELCNPENFRSRYGAMSQNYSDVQNGMDNVMMRRKMSKIFDDFGLSIRQAITSTDIVKEETANILLSVASDISEQAFEFEHTDKIDNPVDYAYGIIAQWSCVTGNVNNDFIRDRINSI